MHITTRIALALLLSAGLIAQPSLYAGEETKEIKGQLAAGDPADPALQKELKRDLPHKVHKLNVDAGKGYVVEMVSEDFDTVLHVEDPSGETIAFDDDSGGGLNSRLVFVGTKKGEYRIAATT